MQTPSNQTATIPADGRRKKAYRPTWIDRYGADGVMHLPLVVLAVGGLLGLAGAGLTWLGGTFTATWFLLPLASLIVAGIGALALWATSGVARAVGNLALANTQGNPYTHQFSYQDALAIRGDVAGALESFEELIASTPITAPTGIEVRVRAAEMYMRPKGNPRRAAEIFRAVQRIPELPANRDLYVSNRLVDLYLGPLRDEGRAMVELRRLIDRYPGTDTAAGARAAIARLKDSRRSRQS